MNDFDGTTMFWCTVAGAAMACVVILWMEVLCR